MFTDDEFKIDNDNQIEWKRPHQLYANAQFFAKTNSCFCKLKQGHYGSCFILSVVNSIIFNRHLHELFFFTCPFKYQQLDKKESDYDGSLFFNFFVNGQYQQQKIDDRLPICKKTGELMSAHSTSNNEFWCSLLEKAIFKQLFGKYHKDGGEPIKVYSLFGPGVSFSLLTSDIHNNSVLLDYLNKFDCFTVGIISKTDQYKPDRNKLNLSNDHLYAIIGYSSTHIKIKNPWTDHQEFLNQDSLFENETNKQITILDHERCCTGDNESKSARGHDHATHDNQTLNTRFLSCMCDNNDVDGEWWMTIKDFLKHFDTIYMWRFI